MINSGLEFLNQRDISVTRVDNPLAVWAPYFSQIFSKFRSFVLHHLYLKMTSQTHFTPQRCSLFFFAWMKQSSLFWHHPWGGLLGCWRRKAYRNHILFGAKERETHAQAPAQWNQRDTLTSPVDKRERERSILVMTVRRADWILAGDLFLSAAMRSELASHGTFLRTARQYTRLHLPLKDTSFSFTSFLCFFLLVFLPSFFSASSPLIS